MSTHALQSDDFDRLAGGQGDVLGVLRDGLRSKRLLLAHELMATARARAPRAVTATDAEAAFALLADVHRRSPQASEEVLLHPHVGAWATACLRGLSAEGTVAPADLGHLGAVAAAAATRAGEPFEVTAYVRDGAVMFPTFGLARPGFVDGPCRLRSRPGAGGVDMSAADATVTVPFTGPAGRSATWLPLRRLRSSRTGVTLDVELDDLDPFRGGGQLATAGRLGDAEASDWQALLDAAWPLLVDHHRAAADALGSGVVSVVPLLGADTASELSASFHEAVGAVAMTRPRNALALALALVHEFQHTKLSALLDLVPMIDRAPERRLYAPWRADPRPLRGLLHGTYAFLGLTAFWEVHRRRPEGRDPADHRWAHFEFARGRLQVGRAVIGLRGSGRLLPPGARFVDGMARALSRLNREPVPAEVGWQAATTCRDDETSWRLRNARPDPEQVDEWAEAWAAGRPRPAVTPRTTVVDGDGPLPSDARTRLVRHRLALPERWRDEADGVTPADVLLVAGETGSAGEAYRRRVAADPDDLAAWAGYALACGGPSTSAGRAMARNPEWVRAVYRVLAARVGPPDPGDLATWIGGGPGTGR